MPTSVNYYSLIEEALAKANEALATAEGGNINSYLITALATIPLASGEQSITITGGTAAGDSRGGSFAKVSSLGLTVDNGIIFASSSPSWYWKRIYSGAIDPYWYGAIAGGTVDNVTAFFAMRDALRGTTPSNVLIPAGTWRIDSPRWAKGIRNQKISGYNATIINKQNIIGINGNPCYLNDCMFMTDAVDPWSATITHSSTNFGYLIDTVSAGTDRVTCSTHSQAANFTANGWCLVYGYSQMDSSFPPAPRHFDYARVVSSNNSTGVIVLDRVLSSNYHSDWYDMNTGKGKARILPLTRSDYIHADHITLEGLTFALNPNFADDGTNGYLYAQGADLINLKDLNIPCLCITCCGKCIVENCDINWLVFDKVVDSVELHNCRIRHSASEGIGIKAIDFYGCQFLGTDIIVQSQAVRYHDCHFANIPTGGSLIGYSDCYQHTLSLEDCEFTIPSGISMVLGGNTKSLTVAAVPAPTLSNIGVTVGDSEDVEAIQSTLGFGQEILTASGNYGLIKSITYDAGNTALVLSAEFKELPIAADIFTWPTLEIISIKRPRRHFLEGHSEPAIIYDKARDTSEANGDKNFLYYQFTEGDLVRYASGYSGALYRTIRIEGYLHTITVHVQRAYTGASPFCILQIMDIDDVGNFYQTINLKTSGLREMGPWAAQGSAVGDNIAALANKRILNLSLAMDATGGGLFPTYSDPSELPTFTIELKIIKAR